MERVKGIEPSYQAVHAVGGLAENLAELNVQGNGSITPGAHRHLTSPRALEAGACGTMRDAPPTMLWNAPRKANSQKI